jgi:hypothetical protein
MSDQTSAPAVADTTPVAETSVADTTVDTTVSTEKAAPAEAPAVATDKNGEILPKFKKADGTLDTEKLLKSYVNLEKKIGAKGNVAASSVEEYSWTPPENAAPLDPERETQFKTMALEQGFTTKQYEFIMNSHNEMISGMLDSLGLTPEKTEANLKEAWGKEFDSNLKAAKAGFDTYAHSTADPHDPIWNHPEVMKLLARVGADVGEDSISSKPAATAGTSIDDQIKALRADPNYYTDPKMQAKMLELYERKK